jgi:hypothetical protein
MIGGEAMRPSCWSCPIGPFVSFSANREMTPMAVCASLPSARAAATAAPPVRANFYKAWLVKAAQEVVGVVGAHLLGLDCHATLDAPHGGSVTLEGSLLALVVTDMIKNTVFSVLVNALRSEQIWPSNVRNCQES